jgi:signal transduction histidine kinase
MTSPETQENPNKSTNAHQVRELLSSVATSMAVSQSEISNIVQSINVSSPAVSQASAPASKSKRERLAELAALLADGIISDMEHTEGRAKFIAE